MRAQEQLNALQQSLNDTDKNLRALQQSMDDGGQEVTPEMEATLRRFIDDKLRIRQQLRQLQFQLNADVERLAEQVKLANTVLLPALLTLLLLLHWSWRSMRRRRADMRLGSIAGLALALALFAGTLGWLHERQQPPAQPPASRAWLPGLKPHQVIALCIATPANRRSAPGAMAGLDARQQGRLSRLGETIRQLLRSLADARLLEEKSASPENRERMGLSDQGKGQASRITLERGDAPPLVLLLGKRTSQGGQLVRQADDERAWLIDRTVGLPVNDLALLDPRLTDLPFEQLRELTLSYGNGVRLNISRASERTMASACDSSHPGHS